jgi:hypothetical protein
MAEVSGVGLPGPLGPFVAGFAAELSRQGYKPQPVGKQLGLLAALSGWLAAEGVALSGLSSDVAERFCAARRAAEHTDRATVGALDPLLGYLRALGVAPPASSRAPARSALGSLERASTSPAYPIRTSRNHTDVPPRRPRHQRTSLRPHQAAGQQTRPLPPPRRTPRIPRRTVTRPQSTRISSADSLQTGSTDPARSRRVRETEQSPWRRGGRIRSGCR